MDVNYKTRVFGNENKYVKEVLNGGFRASNASKMRSALETKFSKRFNVKHAISFINGTSTLHCSLEALGITISDEVIVPPLTFSATAFSVIQANATPVFADINLETFQICEKDIEKKITSKTKAIIVVSVFGMAANLDKIIKIKKKYNLKLIEDNAECMLGTFDGKLLGTFGDCASFSFQSSKHITSGEGGMVITNDDNLADKLRSIQSMAKPALNPDKTPITKDNVQNPNFYRNYSLGWNYRMPELCAAVALGQLENIDFLVERRIQVADLFNSVIDANNSWFVPQFVPKKIKHSYWTWAIKLNTDVVKWIEFKKKFQSYGGDGIYAAWRLTYNEPAFEELNLLGRENLISQKNLNQYKKPECPNAEIIQPRLLLFKTGYWDFNDAKRQAEILAKTLKNF